MNSKFGDHQNTVIVTLPFWGALQLFLHLRLLKLILRFLGLRGKWFGWCKRGLSVNSKFGDHENTAIFALQFFQHCICFASKTPQADQVLSRARWDAKCKGLGSLGFDLMAVFLELLKLRLGLLGLRGKCFGWFRGAWM